MNLLWGGMILVGIVYGALNGTMQEVADAALTSSREAVTLCITMAGVMALWTGLMKIAEESGIVAGLARALNPFIRFLFPGIPAGHPATEHISMNVIANVLGLGWAATPAGLKAMESLAELEEERRAAEEAQTPDRYKAEEEYVRKTAAVQRTADAAQRTERTAQQAADAKRRRKVPAMPRGVASSEMCTFLILNISSLQLIPVNIIAYRAQYGSVNPTAIVGPGIAATAVSTLVAVAFCKTMDRKRRA